MISYWDKSHVIMNHKINKNQLAYGFVIAHKLFEEKR